MIQRDPSVKNRSWIYRPLLPSLVLAGSLALTPGCRKAAVEHFNPSVETRVAVTDPAVFVRPQDPSEKDPWYRELQVVLEQKAADEKELAAKLDEQKPRVNNSVKRLLDDLTAAVQQRKSPNDRWSMLSISCGKTRKISDLQLNAEIGLTGLYAKRPVIAFNELPIELCIAKLSREAGISESQPRGYNPSVSWSQTDVSVQEAFDSVLAAHGFEHKFSDTTYKIALRVQDYPERQEFIDAVIQAVLAKGKALNTARPAVSVTHKEKPAPPPEQAPKKTTVPITVLPKKQ